MNWAESFAIVGGGVRLAGAGATRQATPVERKETTLRQLRVQSRAPQPETVQRKVCRTCCGLAHRVAGYYCIECGLEAA